MTQTTDPQDELFDVLDSDGNPTGVTKPRGEVHRDGDWHRGLHIWVYRIDEHGRPFVLFQRRSMGKDTWPGALDVAVGGHFRAGEMLEETVRETEEEIGLRTTVEQLIPLGRRFIDSHGPGYIDRELNEVFALRCDEPLSFYRQHPDEVDGIVAIGLHDVTAIFEGTMEAVPADEVCRDGTQRSLNVCLSDFAHDRDSYGPTVFASIRAIIDGCQPERFLLRE